MNSLDRCMAAIRNETTDRVPSFPLLMFFAQDRAGITYREFSTNGRAMAEAQLAMRDRFSIDAITACTDAFRVPADLGAEMAYPEDRTPFAVRPLIQSPADLEKLGRPEPAAAGSRMADRLEGIRVLAGAAGDECLVVGWVDMPFAEACSLCGLSEFMMLLVTDPPFAHRVLDYITDVVIDFSLAQLAAGAPMIGAGDAAASLIAPEHFREFALPYEQRVVDAVHEAGGLLKLHICGNTTHILQDMVASGSDLFNVDHVVPFDKACEVYGGAGRCFKGNLDPVADMMQSTPEQCERLCHDLIRRAQGLPFMLSPGCEVPAKTPDEVFAAFCNAPKTFS